VTVRDADGRDLVPPWRGEADFYLEGDQEPSRCFDSNVGMVLQKEGTWDAVNRALQDFGNGFEASSTYRIPLDRLERLAEACREVAKHFEPSRTYETTVRGSKGRSDGVREDFEVRYSATGEELADSMLTLATFAEEAHSARRRIFAVLK
jgi:hypothetical protein